MTEYADHVEIIKDPGNHNRVTKVQVVGEAGSIIELPVSRITADWTPLDMPDYALHVKGHKIKEVSIP